MQSIWTWENLWGKKGKRKKEFLIIINNKRLFSNIENQQKKKKKKNYKYNKFYCLDDLSQVDDNILQLVINIFSHFII